MPKNSSRTGLKKSRSKDLIKSVPKLKVKKNIKTKTQTKTKTKVEKTAPLLNIRHHLISNEEIVTSSLRRIKRLEDIHEARKKQHNLSDAIAYWTFLFVIMVTNFVLSFLIIFLILFLDHPLLYVVIIILGSGFGLIYELFLNGMRHVFLHHHVFAKVFLIITGVINIINIVLITSIINNFFGLENKMYNAIAVSVVYFISFLAPYFITKIVRR